MVILTLGESMRKSLIVLNLLAMLWVFYMTPTARKAADGYVRAQLREMRASGLIDADTLRARYPKSNVAMHGLSEKLDTSGGFYNIFIWPEVVLALLNAVVITLFWKSNHDKEEGSPNNTLHRTR